MGGLRWLWSFFLANVAGGISSLLVPLYVYFLGGSAGDVGAITALSSLAGVLGGLIWGRAADRTMSRRIFIVLGFGGFGSFYLFLPLVRHVGGLFWLSSGANFLWMAQAVVASLLILERLPQADWEEGLGRFNRYAAFGWMVGLGFGSLWTGLLPGTIGEGWALRALGVFTGLAAGGAALWICLSLPEPTRPKLERTFVGTVVAVGNFLVERFRYAPARLYYLLGPRQILRLLQGKTRLGPELTLYFYGILLASTAFSIFFVPLPLYLRGKLGIPSGLVFALYIFHHGMNALSYSWGRRLITRIGHRPTQALGLTARMILFPLFSLLGRGTASMALIPVFFMLTGITWALFQLSGMAIVSRLAPKGAKGEAMGIYNSLLGLGGMVGAAAGGFLADRLGYAAAFIAAGALIFLSLPIILLESHPLPGIPAQGPRPQGDSA